MGRGVCNGGGQSSLGYLLGGASPPSTTEKSEPISNNYRRVDGQNTGNFITERPSTKVQSVPGGVSSLGYLLGGGHK
ncbi:hypothetical protein SUGI_0002870 [Cryptomeria japonica]|uniref:protein SPIRAL1-like 3 n=1 Tax=Cryptomeria japonica TaxID=3369 RepID=UPI002408C3DC|nr:protein SPIRAL1-like 3 [Cryptomeria japonica]GLJ04763.1 hypothetical protein SUGI_0002870 [Cryptomeria japonica]